MGELKLMSEDDPHVQALWNAAHKDAPAAWAIRIEGEADATLRTFLAACQDTGSLGQQLQGRRASVVEVLEERRARRLIETMQGLDSRADKLARVGVLLSIIGTLATIVGTALAVVQWMGRTK